MPRPADIAELERALRRCCADLADAVEAAAAEAPVVFPPGAPPDGPQWRPLLLAPIPGLDTLVSIVKPPLQVIVALLQVIAALLQALAAILIGIPDIFRALIMAAYQLLRDIINDLLNTGAYMYVDAPGLLPLEQSREQRLAALRETGVFIDPGADWKAGRTLQSPPAVPDGFARWAARFQGSFDDPGDLSRPVITDGAPIQAIFIVMAAPSLGALRQAIYLLGKLFNIDAFIRAFEQYEQAEDPRRARARRGASVPPDWKAVRLRDLFPPLTGLLMIPEALRGLLAAVDNLAALIKNLANALAEKANVLLQLAAAIQAIIDLLDALSSTGMYSLGVSTQGGIPGLKEAFLNAGNRPPGGYIGGVCFLAAGPNLAKATMLFDLLGGTTAIELAQGDITLEQALEQGALGQAAAVLEKAAQPVKAAGEQFATTVVEEAQAFADAVANAPQGLLDEVGQAPGELLEQVGNMRTAAVDALVQARETFAINQETIRRGIDQTRQAQRSGARSLAFGFGTPDPDPLLPDPPEEANKEGGGT
jgi:hypothetical protein